MSLGGGKTIPKTEVFVPGYYEVKKLVEDDLKNFFTSMTEEDSYQTFIAPADYAILDSRGKQNLFYNEEKQVKVDILEMAQRKIDGEKEETRQERIKQTQEFIQI
ncbi:5299_t:CDS:1 [Funneliformis geosporum]|nr:5299_t:CDS:1 [Funneliformis geosporum]